MRVICRTLILPAVLSALLTPAAPADSLFVLRPPPATAEASLWPLPDYARGRHRVALVLSGGGARGVAQIGVLRALERHGIPVDFIAATSLGAIVGGLYAAGYTVDELEHLALTTDWDDVLSLTEDTRRRDLLIDQKIADDRSFIALRFEGLEPILPSAVSTGQRLTDFLSEKTLQALYHPDPSFDDLKVRFRAVATDLVSGARFVLDRGSLAEALRASSTVPLLFSPVERDSLRLLDGGLVSNIPVDVARDEGYDVVIAVNSTSGLRGGDDLDAPWKTADQIMGIMMQASNREQLRRADVVITPAVGDHPSSDFSGLDSLIRLGEEAAETVIDSLLALLAGADPLPGTPGDGVFGGVRVLLEGDTAGGPAERIVAGRITRDTISRREIELLLLELVRTPSVGDARAEVRLHAAGTDVRIILSPPPVLHRVLITGCREIPCDTLHAVFAPLLGTRVDARSGAWAVEEVLRLYRRRGYSLARVDSVAFAEDTGTLRLLLNEGVIHRLTVEGGVRTQDDYVLGEFPLREGDVFDIGAAREGLSNLNATRLFEFVYLEVSYPDNRPDLTIRLRERPSQLLRVGVRIDDERNLQGSLDIRDENFRGSAGELGLTVTGGARNREARLEFRTNRLFGVPVAFGLGGFAGSTDRYLYGDAPPSGGNRWERLRTGEYREARGGGRIFTGSNLGSLGMATVEFSVQDTRIRNIENAEALVAGTFLTLVKAGTIIDTKNSYPFPTEGMALDLSYEFASRKLGSQVSYSGLRLEGEAFLTWGSRHTLHPRVVVGFADETMPLTQQFRLGGRESLYGLREDDRRGRQIFSLQMEYRLLMPFRLVFDTYLRLRYDLGTISAVPEELKLSTFQHGVGAEAALDSPVGPIILAIGRGFRFVRDLPENPVQWGPLHFYFHVGYQF